MTQLKEGDIVTLPAKSLVMDTFEGTAVYHGQSSTNENCIVLERHDGVRGAGQNGYWNFQKKYSDLLLVVTDTKVLARLKGVSNELDWFGLYLDHRFGGVHEKYKDLKEKDDRLKEKIAKTEKEYLVLASKRNRSEVDERAFGQKSMLLLTYAQDRIQIEGDLTQFGSRDSLLLSPEELMKQIQSHKRIESLGFDQHSKRLLIGTTMIVRPKGVVRKEMGKFQIELDAKRPLENLTVFNKTWRYSGYDHPHINNGHCCLSEFEQPLRIYDLNGGLFNFVDTIIAFLENVTRGGEYCSYSSWFKSREKITFRR